MTPDPTSDAAPNGAQVSALAQSLAESNANPQVRFKTEGGRLLLLLPPESDAQVSVTWNELYQQLKHRLNAGDRFWKDGTSVHLIGRDRLLDARQLQAIADALLDAGLTLKRIYTSRRQTAVAAATIGYSVEQLSPVTPLTQSSGEASNPLADPLYLQTTVRSGMEVRHPGSIIVLGDVNPGGSVIADGDVLVWGYLRGMAQAGAGGNDRCVIMALRMEPTQIRIAQRVARAPASPDDYHPEVAYVASEGIRIARAADFPKMRLDSRSS